MSQMILMASRGSQLHKIHLSEGSTRSLTVGSEWANEMTFPDLSQEITIEWDGQHCRVNDQLLSAGNHLKISGHDATHFYLMNATDTHTFDIAGIDSLSVGTQDYDDIQSANLHANIALIRDHSDHGFFLEVHDGLVYHNFSLTKGNIHLESGDQLFIDGILLLIKEEAIQVTAPTETLTSKLVPLVESPYDYGTEYPDYHRSPRIIHREPEDKRTIARPSNKPSKPSEQLGRTVVPPLVMIAALVIISVIQPRGIYIIVMLSMTVTTVIFSITSYVKSVRQYKADMKHRDKTYREYLQRKMKELYLTTQEQRHALTYHYPNVEQIQSMIRQMNARIYEKTMYHHDFLSFRAGIGDVETSFEIEFNEEEFTQDQDELEDAARELLSQYQKLTDIPVVTSLLKGPVGYIGQRELVLEQLQQLVMQLAMFHSYHDLQFITVFPEEEKSEWDWMRWLPHASLQELNVRGFIYHERTRDQVLHSLYQVLKGRRLTLEEQESKNETIHFSPHYVVLITDEKLILDHTIMEFFNEDPSELGVSLVFVQDVMQSLPEHVTTVLDIRDANHGHIVLEEGELLNRRFTPDHFPPGFDKESVSRGLAPLNHLQSLQNAIPESVTFLEMYGVERVEELQINRRWEKNETYKSMAVPLGLRGKDDIVELNLHEKAHGPHGLVAGTTGSGKSEIIQSYIISLGINFHPYEVAFLLIDYKGGGMANLFRNMPHLLGTITNLDRAQALRALASIQAELKKRQRLFGEHNVNHINQYQKLYKQGEASEPMPHLYLISDEFAELKAEQPDFMDELVSTARIGRSLGIHLILATQKPTGVVDDQIWSNSKFKLALKVQDASDSNEVLKTPDAAEITLPGRAYLQVGNNEIYELFQSAWSGADYVPDQAEHETIDTTIYAINELGQYDILTEDLSGLDKQEDIVSVPTELDAVIDYIRDYTDAQQIDPLPRPWLPPLPERIFAKDLHPVDFKEAWKEAKQPLEAMIGLLDQPEQQAQEPFTLNLTKDGHIAVFSSPGYGKSTFLQSLVIDLIYQHNPAHLHIYLLDFGTNGLLPLKNLPHVADTLLLDETEKVNKWIRLISNAMSERKKKLSQYGVADMSMYEKASGETVPNILVTIDNFDSVKEADFGEEFERLITQIAREGAGVGIHLVISAGRHNAMRMPLLSNIKQQISLYMIDETETRSIIGKTDLEIEEIPGRGIIKLDEPALFQSSLPAEGEEALAIIDEIQNIAEEMKNHWTGELPDVIPMMPEGVIDFETFKQNKKTHALIEEKQLPLGLDFEDVAPLAFSPTADGILTVVSDRKDRLDRMVQAITKNMTLMQDAYQTMIIDTSDKMLAETSESVNTYVAESDDLINTKKNIIAEINQRLQSDHHKPNWLILIKDLQDFAERSFLLEEDLSVVFEKGPMVGIHFVICGDYGYIGTSFEQTAKFVRKLATVGLISMRLGDQDIFNQPFMRKEKYPNQYECYYAMDHEHIKIKVPQ